MTKSQGKYEPRLPIGELREIHPHVLAKELRGFICTVAINGKLYDAQFLGQNTPDGSQVVKVIRKSRYEKTQ